MSFLDELKETTTGSYLDFLQTDREQFYSALIENWANETLIKIKSKIIAQARSNDYTITANRKEIKGVCNYLSLSILTGIADKHSNSNALLKKEIHNENLLKIFHPKFVKIGERRVKQKGSSFFNPFYFTYYDYNLKLTVLARRAIKLLEQKANSEGIYFSKIGFQYDMGSEYMFDNVYNSSEIISLYVDEDGISHGGEINTCTYFKYLLIEYSVSY